MFKFNTRMFQCLLAILLSCFSACGSSNNSNNDNGGITIPIDPGNTGGTTSNKPKAMWVDVHANFSRLSTKSAITTYLQKMKDTGLNTVYVDVKPGIGYALYDSDILPKLVKWGSESVPRDWDYLGYWIQEADKLGISVIATISTMGYGYTNAKEGLIYDNNTWDGKTQVKMANNNPNTLVDMRNETGVDAAMLDPSLPEVQSFVISIINEIATKYPKLKGICLDYCRWYGANYGFSDATIKEFEAYSGKSVTNKNDIITSTGGMGPLYAKWIEFRSMTITNLITNIRTNVKNINPKLDLQLWASADWASRYSCGQNWASKSYTPTASAIYTNDYSKTGFADQLDVFVLGAYSEYVWKKEYPNSVWTVENFVTTYKNFIKGDCKVYGSITASSYNATAMSDAVYLSMKNTDGLMVFDLSHVVNNGLWTAIKEGIKRVEK